MTQLHHTVRFAAMLGTVLFLTGCASQGTSSVAVETPQATESHPAMHRCLSMGAGDSIGQGIFVADSQTATASAGE